MSKYNADTIKKLTDALEDGQGRVRACKIANIHYSTFLDWMQNKPEFSEAIKKAEDTGNDKIQDLCKRRIIEDKNWQSAAWWLERNYPEKYANKNKIEHSGEINTKNELLNKLFPPLDEICPSNEQ